MTWPPDDSHLDECERKLASLWFDRVEDVKRRGLLPVVALDVDLTLVDNTPRTRRILAEYVTEESPTRAEAWSMERRTEALEQAATGAIAFSILENFRSLGVEDGEAQTSGVAFWRARFFSDSYCAYDVPYPGASAACWAFVRAGALVSYVTARVAATQAVGTVEFLRRYGFPVCIPGASLLMKPDDTETDGAFKQRACRHLERVGRVVAAVDNEPGHCNTFAEAFPDAVVAWMQTRHSPKAPALRPELRHLRGWRAVVDEARARNER